MALKICRFCGKAISDNAKVCPSCQHTLIDNYPRIDTITNKCPVCGSTFHFDANDCPNCGFPIKRKNNKKFSRKTNILIIIFVLLIGVAISITGVSIFKAIEAEKEQESLAAKKIVQESLIAQEEAERAEYESLLAQEEAEKTEHESLAAQEFANAYMANIELIKQQIENGTEYATTAINLIQTVWYNSAFQVHSVYTDKYTCKDGSFYVHFEYALYNLFKDQTFIDTTSKIETSRDNATAILKTLMNPPDELSETYEAIKDCFDAFINYSNLALSPDGNYYSFVSNVADANSNLRNKYDNLKLYTE